MFNSRTQFNALNIYLLFCRSFCQTICISQSYYRLKSLGNISIFLLLLHLLPELSWSDVLITICSFWWREQSWSSRSCFLIVLSLTQNAQKMNPVKEQHFERFETLCVKYKAVVGMWLALLSSLAWRSRGEPGSLINMYLVCTGELRVYFFSTFFHICFCAD